MSSKSTTSATGGVIFPSDPKKSTSPDAPRPSTYGNKAVWATAAAAVDEAAAQRILKEKNWRQNYNKYVVDHVKLSLQSTDAALKIARAGLDYCHSKFEFLRNDTLLSLDSAMKTYTAPLFKTGFIRGTLPKPKSPVLSVPYNNRTLSGSSLIDQLNKWVSNGVIESSARDALQTVISNQSTWLDLSDKYFVLLGAGSAIGPFPILMALGANVIAVDLNREGIWKKLIDIARNSPGTLTFPLLVDQKGLSDDEIYKNAGCNLITQTPEIRTWLMDLYPDKQFIVGSYAYLDGELHVKVSLAMDAIVRDLVEKRKSSCSYLCTPSDCHVIPPEAWESQKQSLKRYSFPVWLLSVLLCTSNTLPPITPTSSSRPLHYVDGIVGNQGPNYMLAKRIQHWRAIISRFDYKVIVSTNVAPSTSTESVIHNKGFKLAYYGFAYFPPIEIFAQNTSNVMMTGLLVYDIRCKESVSQPDVNLDHPLCLFEKNSCHGGIWRLPVQFNTIGVPAAVIALLMQNLGVIVGVLSIVSVGLWMILV